jgi:hypothetical protein
MLDLGGARRYNFQQCTEIKYVEGIETTFYCEKDKHPRSEPHHFTDTLN